MIEVVIPRYFVVAEAMHEIQNPTSPEKLLRLGRLLGLERGSRVLDIASGRGGPALLLAGEYGCTWHGIELSPDFHAVAVERIAEAGLAERVTFELGDAKQVSHEAETYDAALCLGASFVYGSLADTVDALAPAVRPGGHVVVGEPYWRRLPLPEDYEDRSQPWTTLEGTITVFESSRSTRRVGDRLVGGRLGSLRDASLAGRRALARGERGRFRRRDIRARHERAKRTYLRHQREYLGWAIFVGWKRP